MVLLGIITSIGQQAKEVHLPMNIGHHLSQQVSILIGPLAHMKPKDPVALPMSHQRHLRPATDHPIRMCAFLFPAKVTADVMGFQSRGVNDALRIILGSELQPAFFAGSSQGASLEKIAGLFFRSLF